MRQEVDINLNYYEKEIIFDTSTRELGKNGKNIITGISNFSAQFPDPQRKKTKQMEDNWVRAKI